ncbi:MAG TPA: hypothetical protein VMM13_01335 [Euzebya sp.]|nr:hypothetical protein [Euzebya sp.]
MAGLNPRRLTGRALQLSAYAGGLPRDGGVITIAELRRAPPGVLAARPRPGLEHDTLTPA